MVCFCDIPLPANAAHRHRYGTPEGLSFAVAVSKDAASKYDINPVWYIQEETSIAKHLATLVRHEVRATLETIPPQIKPLLPFLKSTIGAQTDKNSPRFDALGSAAVEGLAFEEELEWRFTPFDLTETWEFGYRSNIASSEELHQKSNALRLVVDHADIEALFVETSDDVKALLSAYPNFEGQVKTWEEAIAED